MTAESVIQGITDFALAIIGSAIGIILLGLAISLIENWGRGFWGSVESGARFVLVVVLITVLCTWIVYPSLWIVLAVYLPLYLIANSNAKKKARQWEECERELERKADEERERLRREFDAEQAKREAEREQERYWANYFASKIEAMAPPKVPEQTELEPYYDNSANDMNEHGATLAALAGNNWPSIRLTLNAAGIKPILIPFEDGHCVFYRCTVCRRTFSIGELDAVVALAKDPWAHCQRNHGPYPEEVELKYRPGESPPWTW